MGRGSDTDNEPMPSEPSGPRDGPGDDQVDLETVLADISNRARVADPEPNGVRLLPEQDAEVLFDDTIDRLGFDDAFLFEDRIVKDNLSELLLVLIALREDGTHGKALKQDLATLFDAHLSPGTVYPELHALEDAGVLDVKKLVQTKQYVIDDETMATDALRRAMRQHLALGVFLGDALTRIEHE